MDYGNATNRKRILELCNNIEEAFIIHPNFRYQAYLIVTGSTKLENLRNLAVTIMEVQQWTVTGRSGTVGFLRIHLIVVMLLTVTAILTVTACSYVRISTNLVKSLLLIVRI